jgi:hypothetical protein
VLSTTRFLWLQFCLVLLQRKSPTKGSGAKEAGGSKVVCFLKSLSVFSHHHPLLSFCVSSLFPPEKTTSCVQFPALVKTIEEQSGEVQCSESGTVSHSE